MLFIPVARGFVFIDDDSRLIKEIILFLFYVARFLQLVLLICHPTPKLDETIRGHVFCSFLALVMRKELDRRLAIAGHCFEWADIKQDLKALQEIQIS